MSHCHGCSDYKCDGIDVMDYELADCQKKFMAENASVLALTEENATLRASLAEAHERVAKIQEAVSERDKQLAAAIESWKLFLAALSRHSPQATPKPDHHNDCEAWHGHACTHPSCPPQATTGKCPECGETLVCPKSLGSFPSCGGSGEKPNWQESR